MTAPREDGWEELRRLAEAASPGPYVFNGYPFTLGGADAEFAIASANYVRDRLAAARGEPPEPTGTCWFCKGRFVIDALIAGYDTFDESRLACLACNERMSGDWKPAP